MGIYMRSLLLCALVLPLAQGCGPVPPEQIAQRTCENEIKSQLLNPETAQFFDFTEIDKGTYKANVLPVIRAENNFPAGDLLVDFERMDADSSDHVYRVRTRAEGPLGNTITNIAYCRRASDLLDDCKCRLL